MWIVYLKDTAGIDWGHKYFNQEENARKYWEMLEGIYMYSVPYINRILTEDSPNVAGRLVRPEGSQSGVGASED